MQLSITLHAPQTKHEHQSKGGSKTMDFKAALVTTVKTQ